MGGSKHDAYFGRERGGALQHDGTEACGQFSGINFIFSFFRISILSNFRTRRRLSPRLSE